MRCLFGAFLGMFCAILLVNYFAPLVYRDEIKRLRDQIAKLTNQRRPSC